MYKYYQELNSNEHMLYANEIASMIGILSENNKPHSSLIKIAIVDFFLENDIKYNAIYFNTKKGLREVFKYDDYREAIKRLLETSKEGVYKSLNNKKYKFKVKVKGVDEHVTLNNLQIRGIS